MMLESPRRQGNPALSTLLAAGPAWLIIFALSAHAQTASGASPSGSQPVRVLPGDDKSFSSAIVAVHDGNFFYYLNGNWSGINGSYKAGDHFCLFSTDTYYRADDHAAIPNGVVNVGRGSAPNNGDFKPDTSEHGCATIARSDPLDEKTLAAFKATWLDGQLGNSWLVMAWVLAALAAVIVGRSLSRAFRRQTTARRREQPFTLLSDKEITKFLYDDIAVFAANLRRSLSAGTADQIRATLTHVRLHLVAYGAIRLPDGTIKPKGRPAIRESLLATQTAKKAARQRAAFRPHKPSAPVNMAPEPWEIELADWFADLVTQEVNKELFPARPTDSPFGPENVGGNAATAAPTDDLSYRPNA